MLTHGRDENSIVIRPVKRRIKFLPHPAISMVLASQLLIVAPTAIAGTTFGTYDARTLAMGTTSVASAHNGNAQFYNPALLAFNDEIEERTQDARFYFPLLTSQLSESAITMEDVSQGDPEQLISRAINDFNAIPGPASAQAVIDATASFDASLADLDGEDLFADIYIGTGGGEAGLFKGAGFFFGARVLAGGQSTATTDDRAILAAYQEGLTFIASNGSQGVAHPELFDANGALIDPNNDFDTTVSAAGAVVKEAGVAMSRQIQLFGQPIAAGITVKAQTIETFEDVERLVDDRIHVDANSKFHAGLNFDIGFAKLYGENLRVGLAIKDVIPRNYRTSQSTSIRFRPRARIGAAYQLDRLQLSGDIDITRNEPIGTEDPTQEVAVGAEWGLDAIKVRVGYRHDFQGNRDGVASVGAGATWNRLVLDLAIAASGDAKSAAMQIGIAF